MTLVGGREIHPINVRVGGFYRAPTRRELRDARRAARAGARGRARDGALDGRASSSPSASVDYELVALSPARRVPDRARPDRLDRGLDIAVAEYDEHFVEEHVAHSNALHSRLRGGGTYLVGPLARFALNGDRLSPLAREAAREAGLEPPCRNPFRSIVVRSVEIVYACDEALRLIAAYEQPDAPVRRGRAASPASATAPPRRRAACSTTATSSTPTGRSSTRRSCRRPRRTSSRSRTTCAASSSATPTSPTTSCARRCEQTIRNYDPCISCATHFLDARGRARVSGVVVIGVGNALPRRRRASGSRSPSGSAGACRRRRRRSTASRSRRGCSTPGTGADVALVVDAVASGAPPGTVHRFDASADGAARARLPLARRTRSASATRSSSRARSAGCRAASSSTASRAPTSRPARAERRRSAAAVERVVERSSRRRPMHERALMRDLLAADRGDRAARRARRA